MESDDADSASRGVPPLGVERRPYDVGDGKPPKATQLGARSQPKRR